MKELIISRITGMIMLLLFVIALFILALYGDDLSVISAWVLFIVVIVLFVVGFWLLIRTDLFTTQNRKRGDER